LLQVSVKDHLFCAAWSRKNEWIPKQQKYRQFPGLIDHIKQNWCFKERLNPQLSSGWGLLAWLLIQDVQRLCCCQVAFLSSHKIKSKSRIPSPQDVQNMLLTRSTSISKRSRASQNIYFCIHSNNKMKTKSEGYLFRRLAPSSKNAKK